MRLVFLALSFLFAFVGEAHSAPQKRVALVIGQNNYAYFRLLSNPAPDARGMAALLSANGFELISCHGKESACFDLDRAGLLAALEKFEARAAGRIWRWSILLATGWRPRKATSSRPSTPM